MSIEPTQHDPETQSMNNTVTRERGSMFPPHSPGDKLALLTILGNEKLIPSSALVETVAFHCGNPVATGMAKVGAT